MSTAPARPPRADGETTDGPSRSAGARPGGGTPQRRPGRRSSAAVASAVAIAYLRARPPARRRRSTGCCSRVMGGIGGRRTCCACVDARTPLLVADDQGVRIRLGRTWRGLPWAGAGPRSSTCPRRGLLRDGRLVLVARATADAVARGARPARSPSAGAGHPRHRRRAADAAWPRCARASSGGPGLVAERRRRARRSSRRRSTTPSRTTADEPVDAPRRPRRVGRDPRPAVAHGIGPWPPDRAAVRTPTPTARLRRTTRTATAPAVDRAVAERDEPRRRSASPPSPRVRPWRRCASRDGPSSAATPGRRRRRPTRHGDRELRRAGSVNLVGGHLVWGDRVPTPGSARPCRWSSTTSTSSRADDPVIGPRAGGRPDPARR